ncbi:MULTISPECIES: FMN-binding negative transcriptional regulator [unclassified Mesobacillus]|uniref:FMN-binding negative transcriptional regulator n=1 Tax=unclassified Mesobacillus TaxID=2675270 RepID=UPI002041D459|nr:MULTISPECIES: FMN-binding negative transcriptional regulator [unclassified Mesobacillus]MCM3122862.1 FMN-binding negative transcriptional regulator [Mesobacillus sp. MER 33]MCM3233655.1 FMN-binding negative transcriptional regulator [Mesobacillus sp. MER 48]
MYIPKHFKIEDEVKIYEFIEKYSFATLYSTHLGEHYATHLPLILKKDENALYGHFARPNGQWKDIENQSVLVVFQGPHCYISPSWYEIKDAVPTWNYVSIHIYGNVEIIEDEKVIYDCLDEMVNKYEKPDSPYNLKNVDSKYIEGMSKGIVAFKINIIKIEAKAKLSQNHPAERQGLIIENLDKSSNQNDLEVASLMKKYL